jgi:hypothetical protein
MTELINTGFPAVSSSGNAGGHCMEPAEAYQAHDRQLAAAKIETDIAIKAKFRDDVIKEGTGDRAEMTRPDPLEGNPEQPGWYAILRNLPEAWFVASDYWDGSKWSGDHVLFAYPQRFETEDDAEAWIDANDKL